MNAAAGPATSSKLTRAFRAARDRGRSALVVYIMAGDPDLETTGALVRALDQAGVDVVELGLPFSDPVADGPVIQLAGQRALRNDITVSKILDFVAGLRETVSMPLVAMGYTNPILALGYEAFAARAAAAGISGVIVPDMPPEEGQEFLAHCDAHGLDWVQLAAPTTQPERLTFLAETSRGFLYYVSRTGITGARQELSVTLAAELRAVRERCQLPVAVGFGISTPEQAAAVAQHADGVVVGSAVVRLIGESKDTATCVDRVRGFATAMLQAMSP